MANYIVSDNDLETRKCYICLTDTEPIIYACQCKGTNYGVHKECLERWGAYVFLFSVKRVSNRAACASDPTIRSESNCDHFRRKSMNN